MNTRMRTCMLTGALATIATALACEQSVDPGAIEEIGPAYELEHEGEGEGEHGGGGVPGECPAGRKFTGGGRIDPAGEKVTFGFNVHADDTCAPIKGQLQVVHHPSQTKFHSTSITSFTSYPSPEGGECGEWDGTVRSKHNNGAWHEHDFIVEACDNGEPGSSPGTGPDTFRFRVSGDGFGHGDTGRTPLTGGNIQAH